MVVVKWGAGSVLGCFSEKNKMSTKKILFLLFGMPVLRVMWLTIDGGNGNDMFEEVSLNFKLWETKW